MTSVLAKVLRADAAGPAVQRASEMIIMTSAGATRIGALAVTGTALLGLTKLNLAGPGLTPTIKKLWHTPSTQ